MKKILATLMVAALLVVSATGAFALEDYMPTNDSYSISYSTGNAEEAMYGVVVLSGIIAPDEDYTVSISNIIYIDQVTSDADGDIALANFAPLGAAPSDEEFAGGTVIIGGGDLDSAEIIGYLRADGYTPAPETPDVVYGDIDGNGSVTMNDVNLALKISIQAITATDAQILAGDVDGNGSITMNDVSLILKRSVQSIDKFPVEQ